MRRLATTAVLLTALVATSATAAGPRIVGGEVAPAGAYPWMAALVLDGDQPAVGQFCGGTLIAPDTVLTAAHCVIGTTPRDFNVMVGQYDLDQPDIPLVRVTGYGLGPGHTDLAKVRLATPSDTPIVTLATPDDAPLFAPGQPGTALGWGAKKETAQVGSPNLRRVDVPFVSDEECADAYRGGQFDPATDICAGAVGRDTCAGDSGGPLIVTGADGIARQAGVTSFGRGCGQEGFPGVYAEVPAALGFLNDPDYAIAPIPEHRSARVRGKAKVGHKLRCDERKWQGEGIKFDYAWFGGYSLRPASRSRTFTPGRKLAGKRVNCEVVAINDGGVVNLVSFPVRVHGNGR